MDERTLHIVIAGHVDHGKSTLIGRLFYDTGCLPPDKVAELEKVSKAHGREMEFAFLMDHLEEERTKGITIDIAHSFFATAKRKYVIIDAPGHKEFLKNMITGSSQADAAILLVDSSQGIKEQTLRHCYMLGLLGIRNIAVVINKMDLVEYSRKRFEELRDEITAVLKKLNLTPDYVIPISARKGDNMAKKSENIPWFDGPTVLEALDSFNPFKAEQVKLRFPVQDVYDMDGARIAVGRVEAGTIKKGQPVSVLPGKTTATVTDIRKFLKNGLTEAGPGECIGICVSNGALKRGDVLVDKPDSTITDTIKANIFWLVDKPYLPGASMTFRLSTQEASGTIAKIHKRFDPASVEVVERDARTINPAEVAEVEIKLDRQVSVDDFSEIPEMGRFILEHAGHPVAGGIIIS